MNIPLKTLDQALERVTQELLAWKTLMVSLKKFFGNACPPIKKHSGWALTLSTCAKSKKCDMCPHGLVWRKYYYNDVFLWGRKERISGLQELPMNTLFSNRERYEMYSEAENIRLRIMKSHMQLVHIRKKILGRIAYLRNTNDEVKDNEFTVVFFDILFLLYKDFEHSRKKISVEISDFRKAHPDYNKWKNHRTDSQIKYKKKKDSKKQIKK